MAAFATPADLAKRYDARTIGDILSDSGQHVSGQELHDNAYLKTILLQATGKMKAHLLRAERYTSEELDGIVAAGGDAAEYLIGICCDLAFWMVWQRRPYTDDQQRLQGQQIIKDTLNELRLGDIVFDNARQQDAGTPKTDTTAVIDIVNEWDLWVDHARPRYFPARRSFGRK